MLAHYTNLPVLVSILEKGEIWLRTTQKMNDYREIEWGVSRLQEALKLPGGLYLKKALSHVDPELSAYVDTFAKRNEQLFTTNTYSSSFTFHDPTRDRYGRLSMWRAYGKVALILDSKAIADDLTSHVRLTAMAYMEASEVSERMVEVAKNVEAHQAQLRTFDRQTLRAEVFLMLGLAQLSNKHPGFREEDEWRALWVEDVRCDPLLSKSVEVIKGQEEVVYRLSLAALSRGNLSALVDKVMIGPTTVDEMIEMRDRVEATFTKLGWWPKNGIELTEIPLRE